MATHAISSSSRLVGRRRSSVSEADLLATKQAVSSLIKAIAKSGLPTSEAAVDASLAKRAAMAAASSTPTPMAPPALMSATPIEASTIAPITTPKKGSITSTLQRLRRASFRKSIEFPFAADSSPHHPTSPRFSSPFDAATRARAPSLPVNALAAVSLDAELGEDYYPPTEEAHGRPRLFRSAGSEPLIPAHHLPSLSLSLRHRRRPTTAHVEEDAAAPLPSVAEAVDSSTGFFAAAFDFMAQDHTTPGSSRGTSVVSSARESPRMQSFALASGFKPAYAEDSLCPIEKEPKRRPPPLSLHTGTSKAESSLPLAASDRFEDTFPPEGQVKKITPQLQDWQKELTVSSPPPRPSSVNTPTLFTIPASTAMPAPHLRMRSRASSVAVINEASRLHTLTPGDFSLPTDSREPRRKSMFGAAPQENKRKSLRRPIVVSEVSAPIM